MKWRKQPRLRVDPYLNWQALVAAAKPAPAAPAWCLVRIELLATDARANLARLHKAVTTTGKLPGDPSGSGVTVSASAHEVQHMAALLTAPDTLLANPVAREFYLYRPEALIYRNGDFVPGGFYRILHAGSPIIGQHFGKVVVDGGGPSFPKDARAIPGEVAIGIIDDGIGFANERFLDRRGNTRIKRIWLQDIGAAAPGGEVAVGRVLKDRDIDRLRHTHHGDERAIYADVFGRRSRADAHVPLAFRRSHGTFCLDVAAGADPAHAPSHRPIFAVQLPAEAVADASGMTVGNYILQGFRQIMHWADAYRPGIPLVINFSYGLIAGPKDGSHFIEQALDAMLDYRRTVLKAPTEIVLAAGNSHNTRTNAFFAIRGGARRALDWIILPDDGTPSHVEIWLDGSEVLADPAKVAVMLTPPGGGPAGRIALSASGELALECGGQPVAGMNVLRELGRTGERTRVFLSVNNTAPGIDWAGKPAPHGAWSIEIVNDSAAAIEARLYVQRDNTPAGYPRRGRQSFFDHDRAHRRHPVSGAYTATGASPLANRDSLSAIATGKGPIVVGAAATATTPSGFAPAFYTSAGPSPGRRAPDCAAFADIGPGNSGILAAGTYSGSVIAMNGTSVAAPQWVRHLADHMAGPAGASAQKASAASPQVVPVTSKDACLRLGKALLLPQPEAMHDKKRRYP